MIENFRVYCKDITKNGNSATKPPDQKSDLNEILETQNKKIQQLKVEGAFKYQGQSPKALSD